VTSQVNRLGRKVEAYHTAMDIQTSSTCLECQQFRKEFHKRMNILMNNLNCLYNEFNPTSTDGLFEEGIEQEEKVDDDEVNDYDD